MREIRALLGHLGNTTRLVFALALTPVLFVFFTLVAILMGDADEGLR